jgi:hypothetical protein
MEARAFGRLKMDWRVKAVAYRELSTMPFGRNLYWLAQKYVTHALPRRLAPTTETAHWFVRRLDDFKKLYKGAIGDARYLEFGAGWDLYSNVANWCLGFNCQKVVDVNKWATKEQVNHSIQHLMSDPVIGAVRQPSRLLQSRDWLSELAGEYGIEYVAPCDVTTLPDSSVDLVSSISVLEHIPAAALPSIASALRKVCKVGGVMAHSVDYSDHYSHSDAGINGYHFLQFSQQQWKLVNPKFNYQNRLRHCDHRKIFIDAGFEIVDEEAIVPDNAEFLLDSIQLSSEFLHYRKEDILPVVGYFLMR